MRVFARPNEARRPMTTRDERSIEDHFAAVGAAYEQYIARLRALNRLRLRRAAKGTPEYAAQLAEARRLAMEAYAEWFMLAQLHPVMARRRDDDGGRA
jgi:hypothetical protein